MRLLTLVLILGLCTAGCEKLSRSGKARARPAVAATSAPYDVRPLLTLLQPGEPARIQRQLKRSLNDLPLYDMDLALDLDLAGARLAGSYTLFYPNRTGKPLAILPLLMHPNAPLELGVRQAARLELLSARTIDGPAVTVERKRPTLVLLRFASPIPAGKWVTLKVTFRGTLRRLPSDSNDIFAQALSSLGVGGGGAGASDYGLLAVGDGIATVASAYPMAAPYTAGRFDIEPPGLFGDLAYNDLVNFKLRTTVPPGHTIATNLVEATAVKHIAGGQPVFNSVGAALRDLVLVAGHDLRRLSHQLGPIRVSSIHRASDAAAGKRMLDTATRALALYQQRFGPYPFTELDVAQATLVGGAGGVEFPGMVLIAGMFYRQPSRSTNPLAMLTHLMGRLGGALGGAMGDGAGGKGGGSQRMDRMVDEMGAFVTAHEVAHQYFAGLVGSDCRRHPSVDEPLAQFAAAEYMRSAVGEKQAGHLVAMNVKANYGIYRMLGGEDLPAAQPLSQFPSALAYAAIVYGKAPYFYDALRRAVDANRFRLITLDDWIRSLQRGAGGAPVVPTLARRFFHQRHGDEDLGMDASGDAVLSLMLGQQTLQQLREGTAVLGMKPADLFRMLMGKMAGGVGSTRPGIDPLNALKQLEKLR